MVVCLKLVGRLLFSLSDGSEGKGFRPVPGPLIMHRMLTQTARTGDTESVHAPTTGRVKREGFSVTARVYSQELHQRRCCRPSWCASGGGLELQDALTKRLQGADLGFDAGEGLWQVLLWEAFDQLA